MRILRIYAMKLCCKSVCYDFVLEKTDYCRLIAGTRKKSGREKITEERERPEGWQDGDDARFEIGRDTLWVFATQSTVSSRMKNHTSYMSLEPVIERSSGPFPIAPYSCGKFFFNACISHANWIYEWSPTVIFVLLPQLKNNIVLLNPHVLCDCM